ncbi:MAG TPA: outer membrane beta-barrel protein [Opitutaceae bacterium]|nr:outer membrane beta-barrel protein [Opitutaceae bacterium]
MSLATAARASLWENPDWALLGSLNDSLVYDSNLTLLHDGPSGSYLTVNPFLTLSRQNSDTDIKVIGGANRLEFLSGGETSETDPYFSASMVYPNADNTIPVYRVNALWQQSSQPNEFVGERVQNDLAQLTGEGYLKLSGKLGFRGNAEFDSVKFDSSELNDSVKGLAYVGVSYFPEPSSEFSLNIGSILGQSTPNDPARTTDNVHSTEFDLTLRGTGQLTDKITGTVYGGFGEVTYTGGYSKRSYIPVAGADLTWGLDPRRTVVLAAYSGAQNAPDGTAVQTTHAFVSFVDVFESVWQLTARTGPTYTAFSRDFEERRDRSWDYGAEVAYVPSKRFRVALDLNYSVRNSNIVDYQFDHDVVSISSTYSF